MKPAEPPYRPPRWRRLVLRSARALPQQQQFPRHRLTAKIGEKYGGIQTAVNRIGVLLTTVPMLRNSRIL